MAEHGDSALHSERSGWPTADQLEVVFHAALKASDLDGVMASLEVMARVDPDRCGRLMDSLQTAVHLAKRLHEIADEPIIEAADSGSSKHPNKEPQP